jgi:hypothetical protein
MYDADVPNEGLPIILKKASLWLGILKIGEACLCGDKRVCGKSLYLFSFKMTVSHEVGNNKWNYTFLK